MKIEVLDTTLRDGTQGAGINYSHDDKVQIATILADFGIDFVELGYPSSNKKDERICCNDNLSVTGDTRYVSFGSTRRKNTDICSDKAYAVYLKTTTDWISVCGKASEQQVREVLGTDTADNLRIIGDSIKYLVAGGKHVLFDAEHFFDGYTANPNYALSVIRTAVSCGAERIILCDTNGSSLPSRIDEGVRSAVSALPDTIIGIHCHNDLGLAVANTLTAVNAGVRHVQGTMLGYGERCGNACLATIIPDLQLKMGYDVVPSQKLPMLTDLCYRISGISNIPLPADMPYVGKNAFLHKGGMHCDAVLKDPTSFEHSAPEAVGNRRRMVLSELSGKSLIRHKLAPTFPALMTDEEMARNVLLMLKEKENAGYTYEAAEASLHVAIARLMYSEQDFFRLINYKVIVEQPAIEDSPATATVKIRVKDKVTIKAADGNGPVDALDTALRHALQKFYPQIKNVSLVDYKVRVIDPENATSALVRVLINSTDGTKVWSTVGVSTDIIEASWQALTDSFVYVLTENI